MEPNDEHMAVSGRCFTAAVFAALLLSSVWAREAAAWQWESDFTPESGVTGAGASVEL